MVEARQPDETRAVAIAGGYKVVTYSFGAGDEVVLCLNGGPGLPCDYLREPHACLADHGYRVVAYDQLGCGESDKPADPALWTIERYAEEVETVRDALGLGRVHLLGQSWGGWLSIEYGVTFPHSLKTVILEDTCGDMPHLVSELERLRAALGPETVAMMQQHEAEGIARPPGVSGRDHDPELPPRLPPQGMAGAAAPLARGLEHGHLRTMQGPNEFLYTGNLKDWNRIPDMHRITRAGADHRGQVRRAHPGLRAPHEARPARRASSSCSRTARTRRSTRSRTRTTPVLLDFLGRHRSG